MTTRCKRSPKPVGLFMRLRKYLYIFAKQRRRRGLKKGSGTGSCKFQTE